MARPTKLKYVGRTEPIFDEKGKQVGEQPAEFHNGVPARDLKEEDLALLSDDDIKLIQSGENPLYVDPEKEKAKKERERARVAKQNADNVRARERKSAEKKSTPAKESDQKRKTSLQSAASPGHRSRQRRMGRAVKRERAASGGACSTAAASGRRLRVPLPEVRQVAAHGRVHGLGPNGLQISGV
jgi:hypothetical protein